MATLPNTHECDINIPVSESISLDDTQPNQPSHPAKEVEVVPTYHPRTGYLNLLAYAACNLVSPLPTEGTGVSGSEVPPVETPSPSSNRPPFLPITNNQEKSTSTHASKSNLDKVLAPVSTSTPPALNEPRRGPLVIRLRVRPQHPYKDSSYALRSSKKKAKIGVPQIESSKHPQVSQKTRQTEGNSIASRRPKRRTSS